MEAVQIWVSTEAPQQELNKFSHHSACPAYRQAGGRQERHKEHYIHNIVLGRHVGLPLQRLQLLPLLQLDFQLLLLLRSVADLPAPTVTCFVKAGAWARPSQPLRRSWQRR